MIKRLSVYLSFVRFSHSVFALPFALAGALLAARAHPITWTTVAWILVAMVAVTVPAATRDVEEYLVSGVPAASVRRVA